MAVSAAVRLAVVDLVRHVAVVQVIDPARRELPHALRGTLAGMLAVPSWHVVVAFADEDSPSDRSVAAVLDQARRWASEGQCRLSVTSLREARRVAAEGIP